MGRQNLGCCLVALIVLQLALPALALPQMFNKFAEQGRKFAVKPNSNKKVITESNEIAPTEQQSNGGFQWSNILGMLIQMFLGGSSGGIDKADSGVNAAQGGFNWMSLVNLGLRLMLSTLNNGGSGVAGGLDKADSQSGSAAASLSQGMLLPLMASFLGGQEKADVASLAKQAGNLIQLISSLMDALKVSFSQRSSTARSLGSKDPFSDAAVAAVTIMKGYVDTHKTTDEVCMQRIMCDANNACARDAPDSGYLFCQLGTYAASYLLEKSTFTPLDAYTQAGRQGRTGESCAQIYSQCNEL
ncbi:uncharacterized protein LOC124204684 isoform X1 [Daphnia pulex]|uniref:uncharacterized protein LOC124204684 isoform X1 n=1 Tax=Daphnia pulex TaxID=6669 RepID=UPI001EE0AEB7|nr:uncharacterized protein LOC124204684 isoform X1 [Daphnia pulex]